MAIRKYGYIRVSAKDQNVDRQIDAMVQAGIPEELIFIDKQSGKDFARPEYKLLKRILHKGDILYIKSLNRFGRNKQQILEEWGELTKDKGIDIVVMDMPILDTTKFKDLNGLETLVSDIVLQVLSWAAEDERNRIKESQAEGITAAKKRGKHLGRPKAKFPHNFEEQYKKWKAGEITATKCMEQTGLTRCTFYKLVHLYEKEGCKIP